MREFMPMVVPHPHAGTLTAVGQVTGTQYLIQATGTWVYEEDLPWLLAERRAVCARGNEPVQCFFEARATAANAVPYRPWTPPPTPPLKKQERGEDGSGDPGMREEALKPADPVEAFEPTGVREVYAPDVGEVSLKTSRDEAEQEAHDAEVAEVPPRRKRKF